MRKATAFVAVFSLFAAACGGASVSEGPLKIARAEWVADGEEARAVVSGTWIRGLSTPPTCALLEDGKVSEWPDPGSNTSPEGNAFTREFSSAGDSELDPLTEYRVRCSVSLSTGRTLETVAPISGDVPRG